MTEFATGKADNSIASTDTEAVIEVACIWQVRILVSPLFGVVGLWWSGNEGHGV
jgi:hypothetical protein